MSENGKTERKEKRNDFRYPASYPFFWRIVSSEEEEQSSERSWERCMTRDLSAGGASFFIDDKGNGRATQIQPGGLIEFQLVIPRKPVFGIGEIVRVARDEASGEVVVGVKFSSIEPSDRDRIARIVLNEGLGSRLEREYD